MLRFYTLPPRCIKYPYLFVNMRNSKELYKREFEHAICDCGVYYFHMNPELDEYPRGYLSQYGAKARVLSRRFKDKLLIAIPDYPDDYHPGQFGDNVSRTFKNIRRFVRIEGVNWLPSVQARYLDVKSFVRACKRLRNIADFRCIAIGTVCKTKNLSFIERCCGIARSFFPNAWIHAFGLTLNAITRVSHLIDSFDSMAWTFPRNAGGWSAKNTQERIEYFNRYVKLAKKHEQKSQTQTLWKFMPNQKEA